MNPLNQFTKQITELFTSMTPSARVMAGLLFTTIVVSLGWIFSVQQSTSYEYLLGGSTMTEEELIRVERAFGDAGLPDYDREGLRIRVPKDKKDIYLKALSSANAVPESWHGALDQALSSSNPFESLDLLQRREEAAHERELKLIIERMPMIKYAAVNYDEHRQGFARNVERTASVGVESTNSKPIEKSVLRRIAHMTASYFAGLKPENVTVTDLTGVETFTGSSNPNAPDQNPLLQAQSDWEQKYFNQIHPLLDNYGEVRLAIGVEIDPTLQKESEQLKYDPTVTTIQSQTSKKDTENSKLPPGGRPGADPNAISNTSQSVAASQTPQQQSKAKEVAENVNSVTGHEAIATTQAGLVPTKVSVTVGIPESYYRKLWVMRAMAKDSKLAKESDVPAIGDEDLKKLKDEAEASVKGAISGVLKQVREGDDRFPLVTVYNYSDFPLPEIPKPAMSAMALGWLADSWSTLALLVVVMIALFMMMGWVKAQSTSPRDKEFSQGFGLEVPASASDELDLGETGSAEKSEEEEERPKFQVTGGEMKEDLSALIKQNPDIAVNLLKTWIGEAA